MAEASTKDKMEFAYHMAKHTNATQSQIQRLLRYGSTLNRLAVKQCNEPWTDKDERKRERIKQAVIAMCWQGENCIGKPLFSNDPRGNCLKLSVPDGYTNDWGREGICVPTS